MAELTTDEKVEILMANMDSFFLLVMGIVVFLMQCGFAFLEAGAVRSKNTVNILIKNMLDCLIGGVSYWVMGWAVAYGEGGNGFIGMSNFFSWKMDHSNYPSWFFQFVFAATAATIVSGSIAERCQFTAYFVYSILITGWVYPPVSHWAWDGTGWLNQLGYHDFAGSGVVHILGGVCALVGCFFVGARKGRFNSLGKPMVMPGHSVPLAALGGFILLFGFLAFNGGSQTQISHKGDAEVVGLAIVNTIIGGCGGGLTVLFTNRFFLGGQKWSYLLTLNGALTGMVSQCAGCNVYEPWAALLVGCLGGVMFLAVHFTMLKFQLDDPLDAVAVHAGGGVVGVLSVPFFAFGTGIFWLGDQEESWKLLGINLAGVLAITLWAAFWSSLIFGPLKFFDQLRIDSDTEFRGCDIIKHGEAAYPVDAWVELQYSVGSEGNRKEVLSSMKGLSCPGVDHQPKDYNNAFEMLPAVGKLSKQSNKTFGIIPSSFINRRQDSIDESVKKGQNNQGMDNGGFEQV